MLLEGSCHCGRVRFSVVSREPVPYQLCYCSICRKTGGSGGYMINLNGEASTLSVSGEEFVATYRAMVERNGHRVPSRHQRKFCRECGSHLWAWHENWPDQIHPVASAIDSELPTASEHVHMMLGSKANWVQVPRATRSEHHFEKYPEESLARFHQARGWTDDG